jgi:hypothetical protein
MYDTGKILKTGGGPGYDSVNANANSYVIDINAGVRCARSRRWPTAARSTTAWCCPTGRW